MRKINNRELLIALEFAATYFYLPLVILPPFFWRWNLTGRLWLDLCVYLTIAFLLPILATYYYGTASKQLRRRRFAIGFLVYAIFYLLGNGLGIYGERWYWVHLTALSLLLATGMTLRLSEAYTLDQATTKMMLRGHWIYLGALIAMIELYARRHTWIVFDYVWGTYFAWCAWQATKLKGLEEEQKNPDVG